MNKETITLPKNKPPVLKLILSVMLLIAATFLYKINMFFYIIAFFFILVLIMYSVDFLIDIIRYASDKEKTVVVRKSSIENMKAREYKKQIDGCSTLYKALSTVFISLFYSVMSAIAIYKISDDLTRKIGLFMMYVTGIIVYTKILGYGNKKSEEKINKIFNACDTALWFDIAEQRRLDITNQRKRYSTYFTQMVSAYYMEDYEMMYKISRKMDDRYASPEMEVYKIEYEGCACLKSDNPQGFNHASEMLGRVEVKYKNNQLILQLCGATRMKWDVMISWREKNPDKAYNLAADIGSSARHMAPMGMEYTYILGELQEMKGDYQLAESSFRIVADNAGTMPIRERALAKLDGLRKNNES